MNQRIYLDHSASSPLLPEVIETMMETAKNVFGNPSSIHREGAIAKNILEESRKYLAQILQTSASQVFFTSGATESNNTIICSALESGKFKNIITSSLEHPAVLLSIQYYAEKHNLRLHFINHDQNGLVLLDDLKNKIEEFGNHTFVSLMHCNNEIGSLLPIKEVAEICSSKEIFFHSDTVQSIGLLKLNATDLNIDCLVGSAHKFNGPKGIGFMYLKEPSQVHPLLIGGSQERNMRAGTENIIGISGMIKALELAYSNLELRYQHVLNLNNRFRKGLIDSGIKHQINSPSLENSLPKILNVFFEESPKTEWLLMNLDIEGIAVSGGSACSSGTEKASHTIELIRPNAKGKSLRFSFSHLNTEEEIDHVLVVLKKILE